MSKSPFKIIQIDFTDFIDFIDFIDPQTTVFHGFPMCSSFSTVKDQHPAPISALLAVQQCQTLPAEHIISTLRWMVMMIRRWLY
jgi:hypothetical protein